jgi:predicted cobalt transporter CbtA
MTAGTCSAFPATKAAMTRDLLWRGMLAGILAALLATLFARAVGEPLVDRAIAFETAQEAHDHHHHHHDEGDDEGAEPISRATQKGAGLLTAMALYGAAIGGIFSLVFAYGYGRIARVGPRTLSAGLAILAFLVIALVPALKYPPNPPAVGHPDTIQIRTATYFGMIVASIVAAIVAFRIRALLRDRLGAFDAVLASCATYIVLIVLVQAMLPAVDEVPPDFPAALLWQYRVSALGIQAVLWSVIGIAFGTLADGVIRRSGQVRRPG